MNLSIVVALLNDSDEMVQTIKSLRATAPPDLPIFVIDDCSEKPFVYDGDEYVMVVRNRERIGCAPSRHKGAEMVATSHLMFTDSHMRFEQGWYQNLLAKMARRPECCWNGTCLGLAEGRMDLAKHSGVYTGATLNLFGIDKNRPTFKLILESQWGSYKDDEEIPSFMGACYTIPKQVYFACGGLVGLRAWGSDEPYLSARLWLSGFEIRQALDVRVGHMFRNKAPYTTNTWLISWNKVFSILTLFGDTDPAMFLLGKLKSVTPEVDWKLCMAELVRQQPEIVAEYERNKVRFKHDLRWLCDKFKIAYPE